VEIKIPLGYKGEENKEKHGERIVEDRWVAVRGKGLLGIESLIGS
jgi:hypothetical protein